MSSILRFATAGSVDDGKSSLIGRLLYDSKSILEDQWAEVERASARRGAGRVELALLTDGLRAEREQNITIDVAYRYFNTLGRKFIIADAPGHVQYTRNMVTAASTADLAVVLLDASKGVLPQSKRHAAVAILLGVPSIAVAVNKMDLVGYSQSRFEEIVAEFSDALTKLSPAHVEFFPIAALHGDNVVCRSDRMAWYTGKTLLEHLEAVEIEQDVPSDALRLPIQTVTRTDDGRRWLAGQVESGSVHPGDEVLVLPSRRHARVAELLGAAGSCAGIGSGRPAMVMLDDDIDVSRGGLLADPVQPPSVVDRFEATVCWMGDQAVRPGGRYVLLHGARRVPAVVESVLERLDIESMEGGDSEELSTNDVGRLLIHTTEPLYADLYAQNRVTGSFVLADLGSYRTVGAGMIRSTTYELGDERPVPTIAWIDLSNAVESDRLALEVAREARAIGLTTVCLLSDDVDRICGDEAHCAAGCDRLLQFALVARAQGHAVIVCGQMAPEVKDAVRVIRERQSAHDLAGPLYLQ